MKVAIWIWTVVVLIGVYFFSVNTVDDKVYTGTDLLLNVNTERGLSIDSTSRITLQAGSSDFFLLRDLRGETILGTPTEPPLGWDTKLYFVAGPTQIQGGQWLVEDGTATLHLKSDSKITVTAVMWGGVAGGNIFLILLAGALTWMVGFLIGRIFL